MPVPNKIIAVLLGLLAANLVRAAEVQIALIGGKRVELAGKMQEPCGISKDETEHQIKRFEALIKDREPIQQESVRPTWPRCARRCRVFAAPSPSCSNRSTAPLTMKRLPLAALGLIALARAMLIPRTAALP